MSIAFTRAGPAEILRATQKDDNLREKTEQMLFDILLQIGGNRALMKYRHLLKPSSDLLYYGATTLSGLQTIGEEYTGILQLDYNKSDVPDFQKRLLMILLGSFGRKLVSTVLHRLEQSDLCRAEGAVRPEARAQLLRLVAWLRLMAPICDRLHKALFYWAGYYGQLSKRLTGVQYVLVRQWLKDRKSLYGFKMLSVVTFLYALVSACTETANFWHSSRDELSPAATPSQPPSREACPLCLDQRRDAALTPCGHVFCWACIIEWVQTEERCPVCREPVRPSRVVPLQNYR